MIAVTSAGAAASPSWCRLIGRFRSLLVADRAVWARYLASGAPVEPACSRQQMPESIARLAALARSTHCDVLRYRVRAVRRPGARVGNHCGLSLTRGEEKPNRVRRLRRNRPIRQARHLYGPATREAWYEGDTKCRQLSMGARDHSSSVSTLDHARNDIRDVRSQSRTASPRESAYLYRLPRLATAPTSGGRELSAGLAREEPR